MPTEDDLRRLLGDADAPPVTFDAGSIIRRSRRRRLPAQLGAGAAGVLAIAGIGVIAVPTLTQGGPESATMSDSAPALESEDGAQYSELKRDPYAYLTCGAAMPESVQSMYGLVGELHDSVLTVTNASAEQVTGTYNVPAVVVGQGGVVTAHSGRVTTMIAYTLDLAPGESLDQEVAVPVVACVPGDLEDGTEPLPAGDYDVAAILEFVPAEPDPDLPALTDLVVSPPNPLRVD